MIVRLPIYGLLLLLPFFSHSQSVTEQELKGIDSLIRVQEPAQATALAAVLKARCGNECPKGLLARESYLAGSAANKAGLADSALRVANRWLPQLDWKKETEKSPFYSFMALKGQALRRLANYEAAAKVFGELMDIELQRESIDSVVLISLRINLGNINIYLQQFHQARVQLEQSMVMSQQLGERGMPFLGFCLNSLSYIARTLDEPDKAVMYLEQAIALHSEQKTDQSRSMQYLLLNLAILLYELDQDSAALGHAKSALRLAHRLAEQSPSYDPMPEATVGMVFAELGQEDSARKYLRAAEQLSQGLQSTEPPRAAMILQGIGDGYIALDDLPQADRCLDLTMRLLGADPNGELDFSSISDHRFLHFVLASKVNRHKKAADKGVPGARAAIKRVLEQDLAMQAFLQRRGGENDRRISAELAIPTYEEYLEFLDEQENPSLEKAFELMELGKARLLSEKLQQAGVRQFAGIPDTVTSREKSLQNAISTLEQASAALADEELELARSTQELEKLRQEQARFREQIKRAYPAYYNLKYEQTPISLAQARADLEPDQALLSYFVGKTNIYVLAIDQKGGQFIQVGGDFPVREWISEVRNAMYNHGDMAVVGDSVAIKHATTFCKAAHALYQKLVQPVAANLPSKVRIVPDAELSFLPFDALLSRFPEDPVDFRQHDYLIHEFQFSYSISATLHHQQKTTQQESGQQAALLMAPSFSHLRAFRNLSHNDQEIRDIQAVIGGKMLAGPSATASAFRDHARDYRILHVASHARSDDQNGDSCFIAFARPDSGAVDADMLYARDLYGIPLRADMVVLSACETGLGEWQAGEGIIGLTRACMYAGAKSTVTSLWQVDDARTSGLIAEFYRGLRAGLSKDAALQQAKLHYLETQPQSHPYYWASFIPIGNMAPIPFESGSNRLWVGLSMLLAVVLISFGWKKMIRRK